MIMKQILHKYKERLVEKIIDKIFVDVYIFEENI